MRILNGIAILYLIFLVGSASASPSPILLKINGNEQTGGYISSCWKEENETYSICGDSFGINTAAEPLITRSPFTAHLTLPLQEPPEELGISAAQVTEKNELNKGNAYGSRSWNLEGNEWSSYNMSLGPGSDINFSLAPGLYVFNVFARWDEKGSVSYVFLIQVYEKEAKFTDGRSVEKTDGFEVFLAITVLLLIVIIRKNKLGVNLHYSDIQGKMDK